MTAPRCQILPITLASILFRNEDDSGWPLQTGTQRPGRPANANFTDLFLSDLSESIPRGETA